MSNIPFNTIASVLNTGGVQRQAAAGQAKRTQDEQQSKEVFKIETQRHVEEVEDLDETAVDAVGEEQEKHGSQDKKKQKKGEGEPEPREVVDIAQLSAEAAKAPGIAKAKAPPAVRTGLDISA